MNKFCLICNNRNGLPIRNATSIFAETNKLPSGKQVAEIVSEILSKKVQEDRAHASILCKKCFNACSEYDSMQVKLQEIKSKLTDQFIQSLSSYNLDYENYEKQAMKATVVPKALCKKIVLPASKLQPIPPDLLLKVGRLAALSKPNTISPKPKPTSSTVNLKVTVGTSVLTQTIKTTTATPADSDSIISLSNALKREIDNMVSPKEYVLPDISGDLKAEVNVDDHPMEIDDDCPLSVVTSSEGGNLVLQVEGVKTKSKQAASISEYIELPTLEDGTVDEEAQKYILSKLQILNQADEDDEDDDDDEGHTIVLNGDNGSILRVVSGQKFIYEDGEISLVMPDDESQHDDDNTNDHGDSQDSNDESQIELQVSGDEETANAIIAAAQEQGGAFIKVESGEMYRVKSVHSGTHNQDAMSQMVTKDGDSFRCLLCTNHDNNDGAACAGDADTVMRHMKVAHDARVYICRLCGAVLRKRADYTAHMEEHVPKRKSSSSPTKSKMYTCATCGKSYNSRTLLAEHMNSHTGARPYSCGSCGKTFASKYTHQAHLKTHQVRPRPFKCAQCSKSFLTQQNLIQHEKTHLGVKDFVCNVCNKAFSTQHNLEVHGVVHSGSKSFGCSACGKAFARRAELRDHVRIHTGERPFACDLCEARFTQRSNLHSHRRATHLDDKRYHCTQCPKRFKRRRLLEYHIKSSHTGERPLVCEVCNASFVYPEHYKKHSRIHSGERPYVCEICGKSFNSRDNRNTHRFVHSDKKPYECVQCGAGYMRKQLLYAHMNTSGHLAESIVVNQPRVTKVTEYGISDQSVSVQSEESKTNQYSDGIFETVLDTSDGRQTVNIIQDGEDDALLTIHNIEEREGSLLESIDTDQLDDQAEIVANCDDGGTVRLIQIKLPDGKNGWVALNR